MPTCPFLPAHSAPARSRCGEAGRAIVAALAVTLSVTYATAQSRLTNLAVRSTAGADAQTLIVGFAVGGSGNKQVLVRGIGPSLAPFGVSDAVVDPQLQLYNAAASLAQNDNWGGGAVLTDAFRATGAFTLAAGSRDAALLETLLPGTYSAHLTSRNGPGVALVECYDAGGSAYFTNFSARSFAGTGSNVLTAGFTISGTAAKPILLRGIGPTLTGFGVSGALTAAQLRLFDAAGTEIGNSSSWTAAVTPPALFAAAGAFSLPLASRDAVLFLALPPGNYTAQVGGNGTATGTALVEAYEVDAPPIEYITLQPHTQPAAGAPADPGVGTPSPGPDATPRALTQARPQYPFELRRANITGTAIIDFYVKTDGRVANATAIRATDIRFASAGIVAVNAWTFVPGRRNGALVTTHLQVPIIFELQE